MVAVRNLERDGEDAAVNRILQESAAVGRNVKDTVAIVRRLKRSANQSENQKRVEGKIQLAKYAEENTKRLQDVFNTACPGLVGAFTCFHAHPPIFGADVLEMSTTASSELAGKAQATMDEVPTNSCNVPHCVDALFEHSHRLISESDIADDKGRML